MKVGRAELAADLLRDAGRKVIESVWSRTTGEQAAAVVGGRVPECAVIERFSGRKGMELESILETYGRFAAGYDFCFGPVFHPGRKAIIERMRPRRGESVLEVGVGTGLSLPLYPRSVRVTGIDVSPEMLARAQARVRRHRLDHVGGLCRMDAERMAFADASFDKVVAMYVVSVVAHPERLIAEMRRVCRPGGEICVVNHFHSANLLLARLERLAAPLSKLVGFDPTLRLDDLISRTRLDVVTRHRVNLLGYWTLLRARPEERGAVHACAG